MTRAVIEAPAGAAELFEEMFSRHFTRIRIGLFSRVEDWDLADDLAQRTFAYLWEQTCTGQVDLASVAYPFAWLMTRARWTAARHFRSTLARAESTLQDDLLRRLADTAERPLDVVTARIAAGQMLLDLPSPARRVLALHLLEDLPVEDVAACTGQDVATVTTQVRVGIAELRARLRSASSAPSSASAPRPRQLAAALKALAEPPVAYHAVVRQALRAVLEDGTYPAGTLLPRPAVLLRRHVPPPSSLRAPHSSDVLRALIELTRRGLLIRTADGFQVPVDVQVRLRSYPGERVSARQVLARELLAGAWSVGTVLPSAQALSRRWGCCHHTAGRALADVAATGALTVTGSRYVVAELPTRQ